ncbi:MAG: Lar family restriction alleviation protein [Planctomycetia bacterium]|nr:Lar family restriction alleviation protein [Planctomycetia bacterium]
MDENENFDVDLRPCPFCGQPAEVLTDSLPVTDRTRFAVICQNRDCKAIARTPWYKTKTYALKIWNTRNGA